MTATLDPLLHATVPEQAGLAEDLLRLAHGEAGGPWFAAAVEEVRVLLGADLAPDAPTSGLPERSDGERACREFAEQFVFSVGSVSDDDVDRLRAVLGSDLAVYEFVSALWVVDLTTRVELAARQALAEEDA